MRKVKYLILILFIQLTNIAYAQKYEQSLRLTEFNDLLLELSANINEIPFEARRVAFFDITSRSDNPLIISQKQLRLQLEDIMKKKAFSVISIPELERKMILKIDGNDSSIKIDNQSSISLLRQQPEVLADLCKKYGIQSLIDCNLFFDSTNGFVINLRFVNATTREVLWNETMFSRLKESTFKTRHRFNLGAGLTTVTSYQENNTVYPYNNITLSIMGEYSYDQNMSESNTSFFGLYTRLNYYNLRLLTPAASEANKIKSAFFPGAGIRVSKLFYKKKRSEDYLIEYQFGGGATIYKKIFGQINQSINLSLTRNFGMGLQMEYNLIAPSFTRGVTTVSFNNINYAFYLSYKL